MNPASHTKLLTGSDGGGFALSELEKRYLFALLVAAFVVRVVVFLLFQPWVDETVARHVIVNDAEEYDFLAHCIVSEWSFCGNAFRTPGYPLYVAAFYGLFGAKPWIVLLSQIFIDLGTMLLIIRIGQLVLSARVGLIAATLYAFDPNVIVQTTKLYAEPLFVCLLVAGMYAYMRALFRGEFTSAAASGVLLAFATLVRPLALYFFVFLVLFAVVWSVHRLSTRLRISGLLVLAFVVTMSPWLYRNHALYDTVGISTIQGENLLSWQVTYVKSWETGQPADVVRAEFRTEANRRGYRNGGNPFENAAIAQEVALEYIASRPKLYAYRLFTGVVNTFGNLNTALIAKRLGFSPTELPDGAFKTSSRWELVKTFFAKKSTPEIVVGLSVLLVLLVHYSSAALGAVILLHARQYAVLLLFGAAIGYFAVAGGPIGIARFRLPFTPFYLLIGGVFIDHLLHRIRAARPG